MYDADDLDAIREGYDRWVEETYGPTVDRFGERSEAFRTDTGGQPVDPLYTPADVADLEYGEDLGFPGEPPYTRGVYSTMYRGRLWTMRQYAGMGTAAEADAEPEEAPAESPEDFGIDPDEATYKYDTG